jgi:predicted hotdog family 3-hydroxylacyl-ACP dehydratase
VRLIGRDQIAAMIPHAGEMCLLDEVLHWDEVSVRCASRCYAGAKNPMRRADGVLGAACGIEIAAQAMAVHGRLSAQPGGEPGVGYLASVRDVRLAAARLDGEPGDVIVEAARLMGDSGGATYRFSLTRDGAALLIGRATVLLTVTA